QVATPLAPSHNVFFHQGKTDVRLPPGPLGTFFERVIPMPLGLIGTKVGMTQVYTESGAMAPVTVLQVGPCTVLQVKAPSKTDGTRADGYHALQLGYLDKARRKATKAESGHVSADLKSKRRAKGVRIGPKPNCEPKRHIREVRLDGPATHTVGAVLTAAEV